MKLLYCSIQAFLLFAFAVTASAQTTVTIGAGANTGATNSNVGPIYRSSTTSTFDFSHHYYLLTSLDMLTAGVPANSFISSISFNKASTFGTEVTNTSSVWEIYMKNSAASPGTTWSSSSFATQSTGATLVYSNSAQVIPSAAGWITLTFATPFLYTGGSLEIGSLWNCSAHTGNPSTGAFQWKMDPVTGQCFGGSAASATITMSSQTSRPQMQLVYTAANQCSGQPTAGSAQTSSANVCPDVPFTLSLSGNSQAGGITYQWQSSANMASGYTNILGATSAGYSTTQTVNTYYRCVTTCVSALQSDTSAPVFVQTNSFLNCYCTSNATSAADEEILKVQVGTLSNSSTCGTTGGAGSTLNMYSNYTSLPAPSLARSVGYPMEVQIGTCGGNYSNRTSVFIDWNQNGSFADPGETVYAGATVVGPHFENFTLNIPVTATLGLTRMRVINVETSGTINPCGTYSWGETEDYLIEVFPVPTCPQPTNFTLLGSTTTTASLDWNPGGGESEWQVQYGPAGFALGTGTNVSVLTNSNTQLNGLTPQSFYTAYVRAICTPGDSSFWAGPVNFNTYGQGLYMEANAECGPGFIDITNTGIDLNLTDDSEAGFTLPFPWLFQGTLVNTITVGNNGGILVNTTNGQVGYTMTSGDGFYPFVQDLDNDINGVNQVGVLWAVQGTAPNRKFIVMWKDRTHFSGATNLNPCTFEFVYDEATTEVYYTYPDVDFGNTAYDFGADAEIGVQGPAHDVIISMNSPQYLQENDCVHLYYTNCPKPTNIVLQYVTPDEAAFSWTAGMSNETQWLVVYDTSGFDPMAGGTSLTVTPSPSVTLVGLQQLTNYDIYVMAICANGDTSFASMFTFRTLPLCSDPNSVVASTAIDSLFSNWNWTAFDPMYPITSFELHYGFEGFDPATGGNLDISNTTPGDTTYDPNFLAGGVYQLYVRAVCDTLTSNYVGPVLFKMPLTNDSVCGAETLPVDGISRIFNNQGATTQVNENTIAPPITGAQETDGWLNNSLNFTTWFKFQAPASGNMRVNATDRTFNGQIAVYEIITCNDFTSFNLIAANDDEIDGTSLAPNFTICGLTPGAEYYLMHDSYSTSQTGTYALALSPIALEAGVAGNTVAICSKDTINLFTGIAGYQSGGVWNDIDGTFHIVNDSLFNTSGLAYETYNFEYRLTDGCATDAVVGSYRIYPPSRAGNDGSITICKNEPFSTVSALGGTFDAGGIWKDANNNQIAGPNVPQGTLNIPGNYNYTYLVNNGVCPQDTAIVTVSVMSSCDFMEVGELEANNFTVYPNPTNDKITVSFDQSAQFSEMVLIDINGKVLTSLAVSSTSTNMEINLNQYERGVYILKAIGRDVSIVRIVKE